MALTDMTVRNAKPKDKAYKLTDSIGLFLFISPAGSKLWRFRYRFENKEQTFCMSPYPEISLSEARSKRADARKLLANSINPGQ
ncbi:Integrase [Cronobacter condimenti 1330]|uniref:Integrase n=1 Tax=Cronobacter condimenti 1330 TaxID=1073999 RepID=K7ZZ14_9ENTR|nr:Arm DNA-binding domain-containing protein [Cronobacter condimenti]CCJ71856.1 Integrase [Cronobacter condimenti 1330]